MTRNGLAWLIYSSVVRRLNEKEPEEIVSDVEILLDSLQPKDIEKFSKWGLPEDQVRPGECWPTTSKIKRT